MLAQKLTLDDYLAREALSEVRHEFVNGEADAMAGAELAHNVAVLALGAELRAAVRPRGCRVAVSDQRVLIEATGAYVYPDVVVICGKAELVDPRPQSLVNPTFLVEVLSPTTSDWDRGGKAAHYQRVASLLGYALLDPDARRLEVYVRQVDGSWRYTSHEGGQVLLGGLEVVLDMDAVLADLPGTEA